ncbi:spore germination protein GerPE [Paenibacillus hodogayensis]|uniref:Spore germination protein GerPE n=1 Tax=Paenibacillus hodogayensis TaxID=279208 RepID=A0ABV5W418_9BACL
METRTSTVWHIHIKEVGLASTCLIGDCIEVKPVSKALAVQRQTSVFSGNEGSYDQFPLFSRSLAMPEPSPMDDVRMDVSTRDPFIRVQAVDIISVSSSSVLQVGSNCAIRSEVRVKHIRQLQHRPGAAGSQTGGSATVDDQTVATDS